MDYRKLTGHIIVLQLNLMVAPTTMKELLWDGKESLFKIHLHGRWWWVIVRIQACYVNSNNIVNGPTTDGCWSVDESGKPLKLLVSLSRTSSFKKLSPTNAGDADHQLKAMEMKSHKQELCAVDKMRCYDRVAETSGADISAVVTLKVDYQTHCNDPGILGNIYDFKPETGGILVCCEHAVITHDGAPGYN